MSKRLYIGRLPGSATIEDLEDSFRKFGRLRDCIAKTGYGFVVSLVALREEGTGREGERLDGWTGQLNDRHHWLISFTSLMCRSTIIEMLPNSTLATGVEWRGVGRARLTHTYTLGIR